MTTIKLPSLTVAEAVLPEADSARINRVGRRVNLAKAFAVKFLGMTEISMEELLDLTEYIKDSVQKIGTPTADEVVADEAPGLADGLPEIKPEDAFFGSPQCSDPKCTVHGEGMSDDALRIHIANIVKMLRSEMHPGVYAKVLALLEDARTELIRTPLGILLRAAPKRQSTPPGYN